MNIISFVFFSFDKKKGLPFWQKPWPQWPWGWGRVVADHISKTNPKSISIKKWKKTGEREREREDFERKKLIKSEVVDLDVEAEERWMSRQMRSSYRLHETQCDRGVVCVKCVCVCVCVWCLFLFCFLFVFGLAAWWRGSLFCVSEVLFVLSPPSGLFL